MTDPDSPPGQGAGPALERREVGAGIVLKAGRVLVQTRAEPGRYQGYWEFPGGGREEGESIEECTCRELMEELGFEVRVLRRFDRMEWEYPGVQVRVDFMLCAAADDLAQPVALEGQEFRWASVDELAELQFLPANLQVLEKLRLHLSRPA